MNKEKQIEIEVITYEQERLNYFTDLMNKANNKFNRLFKKYKDAPYLSEEFQRLSDAGRGAEFYKDVVKMLEKSYRKQSEPFSRPHEKGSEWISVEVVRCKDCKHYKPQTLSKRWENKTKYCCRCAVVKVKDNDFCSYGEPKMKGGVE